MLVVNIPYIDPSRPGDGKRMISVCVIYFAVIQIHCFVFLCCNAYILLKIAAAVAVVAAVVVLVLVVAVVVVAVVVVVVVLVVVAAAVAVAAAVVAVVVVLEVVVVVVVAVVVVLSHVSTIYLPSADGQKPALFGNAVEQIAYDPHQKLIYAAGSRVLHVINATNPVAMATEISVYSDHDDFTDIELCGDRVFLTLRNLTDKMSSYLRVYKTYNTTRQDPLEMVLQTEGMASPLFLPFYMTRIPY
ncbi:hypothetical protein ElyMa_005294600 [Elysia marginata]|uniref:Sema domain-containing protein n=1 Tax=Elysia marginata TaxID=1093978 RepID=A0AAV4JZD3_9GAST|nr:hypothetical protein ElyMa_005294600 [Elysia marginata]